jgi:GntR family transcriptional regulator
MTTLRCLDRRVPSDVTYRQLADELATQLARLRPGERLSSEHELAHEHGVSRLTARAALAELEHRHLVRRVRGSGTFVALRLDYVVAARQPPSFSEVIRRHGFEPTHDVESVDTMAPSKAVSASLGLRDGARVTRIRRVALVDGVAVSFQTHWLPADLVRGIGRELERHDSLYATLRDVYEMRPERWWNRAELITTPPDVADRLDLEGPTQAWFLESCNRCRRTARVIELAHSWLRVDAFRLRFEHGPSDGVGAPVSEPTRRGAG